MARAKPTKGGKVPPPKKHYPKPHEEPRSRDTQKAVDRWFHRWPERDADTPGGDR